MILDKRLSEWAEQHGLRAKGQAGFRKNYYSTNQLFILRTLIEKNKAKKKPLYCYFMNLKNVFDIVSREVLWQVLASLGVEGRFLRCLQAMYAKDTIRINHPSEGVTSSFRCQQGVKQGCLLSPLLFGLYLDALEGRLDGRECDAPTLANVHVWLFLFANELALTSESEVGLQQHLDTLQQFYDECGLIVNVKKTKVMAFNFVDPCQEFVFEGDIFEHVQTFKYLGILLETTSNLDSAMEHLVATSRHSLFALNRHYAELHIMDIKLHCDLFNTLVRFTASYAYEVWVDSKKIEAIEVVYRRFFKSLLGVQKTTSTSIVLVEFGKFPFEHFAWGQTLLYYNRVNTVTKDRILGKAWEAQFAMFVARKKCWAGSVKKWLFQNQPQEVASFLPPAQSPLEMTL